ncbi:NAD(P)-dependent malic enzyme [Acetohalobium arabaticum]|uniref:Malate dehydrogenase (Oxaloacetate-decarboxylating) n=1 Tax=Acetohalobium arabaticum (strain ATCC 49924 / DSM 5501 / Z-7288) TaxID=574087 RepID=D9QPP4_ACEAZ|nr:malic enzyme-like NAD(P)-binding protein [Acetohalobium arabaticum]ADL12485.1 Malate dehydrogenase (oxaloacetate-decarboxylating) [Acetohalobium arabaticum DSM 5501]
MSLKEEALKAHSQHKGKIKVESKIEVKDKDDLSIAYTPGVAEPCKEIDRDIDKVYEYTAKGNLVAIVSDGSAVLGLGNIGPEASLPVMEGKAVLFKEFAGVDAFPLCLDTQNVDEIVETVKRLAPTFGGINLEDISSPRCIEIETRLKEELDLPIFHDDQHGTAIVVLAGLINALKYTKKELDQTKVVVNGAGSAGIAIAKLLLSAGVKDVIMCDIFGILHPEEEQMNSIQAEMAEVTNKEQLTGDLASAMEGADVFIGVSAPDIVSQEMVASMADDAIIFAMANPVPEIRPDAAKEAGAVVVGTGRSDYANQINNVLAFPGIFRGALDVRATDINKEMKIAAAYAIANLISEDELAADYIIPDPFDKRVVSKVAAAVSKAAMESGIAQVK